MLTWCQPKLQNNRLIKSSPAQFAKKLWHPIWWNAANVIIWTVGHALMYGFRRTKHVQTAMQLTRHLPNPTCLWQTELLRLSSNALPVLLSLCTQDHISLSAKEWTTPAHCAPNLAWPWRIFRFTGLTNASKLIWRARFATLCHKDMEFMGITVNNTSWCLMQNKKQRFRSKHNLKCSSLKFIKLIMKMWRPKVTFTRNLKDSNLRTHKNNYAQQIIYFFSGWTRKTEGLKCWMMKFSAMFVKN